MQQPQLSFDYNGRHVVVSITQISDRWHWSYQIDDSSPYELNDTAESSHARALQYASDDAKHRIDDMDHATGTTDSKDA